MSKKLTLILLGSSLFTSCGLVKERPPSPERGHETQQNLTPQQAKERAADFFTKLGLAAMAQDNYAKAIANFKRAAELTPNDPVVWKNLGEAYLFAKFYKKAEKSFLRALKLKPDYGEVMFDLGLLYYQKGQYKKAVEWFNKAANLDTYEDRPHAFYMLAQAYKRLGDEKNYVKALQRAIDLYPAYKEALLELARYFKQKGNYSSAESFYRLYLLRYPQDYAVKLELAQMLIEAHKINDAKYLLKDIVENCQDPSLVERAYKLVNRILVEEAKQKLKRLQQKSYP